MKAVHRSLVARKGSNATLICVGRKVASLDTKVTWTLNGQTIKENTNMKLFERFLQGRRGNFSLHITNVSEKDVGKYTCVAEVGNWGLPDVANDSINLTLYKNELNVATTQHNITVVKEGSTIGTTSYYQQKPTRSQSTHKKVRIPSTLLNAMAHTSINSNLLGTILFIILGLLVGLITMTVLIIFWRRRRRRPPPSIKLPPDVDESDFKYDVFVTYSRKDFPWVDKELLSLLRENEVKFCVDHLHFELGKAFVESMVDSVYQSRKVLAVWSGSYASSKYCKQELDYAIQRSFQNSDCSVIVIRLDRTDRRQLPKPLRAKTFLDYSDSVERKGWEKRLITHLKGQEKKAYSIRTIV
ncbi:uncharacterized protein LOC144660806 isoform X2 [Oculina patagonica]